MHFGPPIVNQQVVPADADFDAESVGTAKTQKHSAGCGGGGLWGWIKAAKGLISCSCWIAQETGKNRNSRLMEGFGRRQR